MENKELHPVDIVKIVNSKGSKFLWKDVEYENIGNGQIKNVKTGEVFEKYFYKHGGYRKTIKILETTKPLIKYHVNKPDKFQYYFDTITKIKSHYMHLLDQRFVKPEELYDVSIEKINFLNDEIIEDEKLDKEMLCKIAKIFKNVNDFPCPNYVKQHAMRVFNEEFTILYFKKENPYDNFNVDLTRIKKEFKTVKTHAYKNMLFVKINDIFTEEKLFYFKLIESSEQFKNAFVFKNFKLTSIIR